LREKSEAAEAAAQRPRSRKRRVDVIEEPVPGVIAVTKLEVTEASEPSAGSEQAKKAKLQISRIRGTI
jgi:hypothetical protein